MKKIFTLASLLLAGIASQAQTVPGGDMESFHTVQIAGSHPTLYTQAPLSWYGLDSFAVSLASTYLDTTTGAPFKKQVYQVGAGHVGAGAKIWTVDQDTLHITAGCLSNCAPSVSIPAILSGTPFLNAVTFTGGTNIATNAHRPSKVGVWLKYTPRGIDTGHVIVNVLNAGDSVIGHVDSMITGTIASYTFINPTITYVPAVGTGAKKLQVIVMSSTLGEGRGVDSSMMEFDDAGYTISTGIEETNAKTMAVRFGPNPSTGIVYLYSNVSEKLSWQVYNANGQVVVNKELAANNREDLSNLPSGTYFYNVINSQGEVIQKDKFTIAK
jgi:hypothetical protein